MPSPISHKFSLTLGLNFLKMVFGNFKLADFVKKFDFKVNRETDLFANIPEIAKGEYLEFVLKNQLPFAIDFNTK